MIIASAAQRYIDAVVPTTGSMVQRLETRRAFFAGAAAMLHLVEEVAQAGSEQASMAALAMLRGEIERFRTEAMAGRA